MWAIETAESNAFKEMQEGSDRVCVIMGAALLDIRIRNAVASRLAQNAELDPLLDSPLAPLKPYAARARIAQAIGIFGPKIMKDALTIGKIRNDFAHQFDDLRLDRQPTESRCLSLWIPNNIQSFGHAMGWDWRQTSQASTAREHFTQCIQFLSTALLQYATLHDHQLMGRVEMNGARLFLTEILAK